MAPKQRIADDQQTRISTNTQITSTAGNALAAMMSRPGRNRVPSGCRKDLGGAAPTATAPPAAANGLAPAPTPGSRSGVATSSAGGSQQAGARQTQPNCDSKTVISSATALKTNSKAGQLLGSLVAPKPHAARIPEEEDAEACRIPEEEDTPLLGGGGNGAPNNNNNINNDNNNISSPAASAPSPAPSSSWPFGAPAAAGEPSGLSGGGSSPGLGNLTNDGSGERADFFKSPMVPTIAGALVLVAILSGAALVIRPQGTPDIRHPSNSGSHRSSRKGDDDVCWSTDALLEWSTWSSCPQCGGGERTRRREIARGFQACQSKLSLAESLECAPPALVLLSDWSSWGACSTTCGVGRQLRARHQRPKPKECKLIFASHESKVCERPCPHQQEGSRLTHQQEGSRLRGQALVSTAGNENELATKNDVLPLEHGNEATVQRPAMNDASSETREYVMISLEASRFDVHLLSKDAGLRSALEEVIVRSLSKALSGESRQVELEGLSLIFSRSAVILKARAFAQNSTVDVLFQRLQKRSSELKDSVSFGISSMEQIGFVAKGHVAVRSLDLQLHEHPRTTRTTEAHAQGWCPDHREAAESSGALSRWGQWGMCSQSCHRDVRGRHRDVLPGWQQCNEELRIWTEEFVECGPREEDLLTEWSGWGACSKSCGTGSQSRQRSKKWDFASCHLETLQTEMELTEIRYCHGACD
ncbi:unnamed protein product [Polarella glacialis]|uniref:Uncharacterized protein n=1 Tax=Polarella glacialis TaxID=89957 RepID=A0A813KBB6_POLGL|nr:unnamed protein product [Polarella glacialis]